MAEKRLPPSTYDAKYPYNRVTVTESGHEIHLDDTPGKRRIRISHAEGSYQEISNDGRVVEVVVAGKHEYVKGGLTTTVDKNIDQKVGGSYRQNVSGDTHTEIKGQQTLAVGSHQKNLIGGDQVTAAKGDVVLGATGGVHITAAGGANTKIEGNEKKVVDGTSNQEFGKTLTIICMQDINVNSATRVFVTVGDAEVEVSSDFVRGRIGGGSGARFVASRAQAKIRHDAGWVIARPDGKVWVSQAPVVMEDPEGDK